MIVQQKSLHGYSHEINFGDNWRSLSDSEVTRRLAEYGKLRDGAGDAALKSYAQAGVASIRDELERRRGESTVAS